MEVKSMGSTHELLSKLFFLSSAEVGGCLLYTSLHAGKTPEDMMQLALAGFAPNVLDERTVQYQCDCSHDDGNDTGDHAIDDVGRVSAGICSQRKEVGDRNHDCLLYTSSALPPGI